jgi:hypothetical protein
MILKMKKLTVLFFILFFIFCIGVSSALDCQYTEEKEYPEEVTKLYNADTDELISNPLILSDFYGGYGNIAGSCKTGFTIKNTFPHDINVNVKYKIVGPANSLHDDFEIDRGANILIQRDYYEKIKDQWGGIGSCSIPEKTVQYEVTYNISELVKLISRRELITKLKDVCKQCPEESGFICINDGQPADSDEKCGSGKRNIGGICTSGPLYIVNDYLCSKELGENCKLSPMDCGCEDYYMCNSAGKCVANPNDPPEGMDYCNGEFRKIKAKSSGLPCECDFECKEGVCYLEICQKLLEPKLRCPTGTTVKKGETLQCNIYASNVKIKDDLKITFELEPGSGLSFSASEGCQNIKGSQCIGTYDVSDLSSEGINVDLNGLTYGDTKVEGRVTYEYNNRRISTPVIVDFESVHVSGCGDGIKDDDETKYTCCLDVPVNKINPFAIKNDYCINGEYKEIKNWWAIAIYVLLIILPITYFSFKIYNSEYLKRKRLDNEGRQADLQKEQIRLRLVEKEIESTELKIRSKQVDLEYNQKLLEEAKKQKAAKEEIAKLKSDVARDTEDLARLQSIKQKEEEKLKRETEKLRIERTNHIHEKERLRNERRIPFTNKQGYPGIIINENGYEQFQRSLKYPSQPGRLFHRWFAERFIYDKNRDNYPLSWDQYEVDHKDGNKRNNDLSNLQILRKHEHRKKHNL